MSDHSQIEQAWQKFDRADAQLEDARAEVTHLQGLLAKLEWACHETFCPVCTRTAAQGHATGCWLAAEITQENIQ